MCGKYKLRVRYGQEWRSWGPGMSEQVAPSGIDPARFKDRSTGLIVFGVIAILVGALCACIGLMTPFSLMTAYFVPPDQAAPVDVRSVIVGTLLYVALAGLFIGLGIGSFLFTRWLRPIMLSVAWTWRSLGLVA